MTVGYSDLIDAETWRFIERTNRHYPADAVQRSLEEQRRTYDRMCREFHSGYPVNVSAVDRLVSPSPVSIPVRHYRRSPGDGGALVVYFHGGGFMLGGLESHDDVCADICEKTHYDVISVDYRLAPEHKHPAAFDDCLAAYLWASEEFGRPLLLCGDSAGGNLAAAVAHHLRGSEQAPIGQLLIYPGLGADPQAGSYLEHAHAPLLTRQDILFYKDIRMGAGADEHDPRYAPLKDVRFDGLPPTVVLSAECDPLSDDGRLYCERIQSSAGKAVWFNEKGLVHGYLRARHSVRRAAASFERITSELRMLGQGRWEH